MKSGDTKLPKEQQKFGGVVSWLKALMFVETVSMKKPKSPQWCFWVYLCTFYGRGHTMVPKSSIGGGRGWVIRPIRGELE